MRYRNSQTDVVIDVPAEKAARMGAVWVPVEKKTPTRKPGRPKKTE